MFWNEKYQPENMKQAKLLNELADRRKILTDALSRSSHLEKTLGFQRAQGHRGYYVNKTSRDLERINMYIPGDYRQYDEAERKVYQYNKSRGVSYI